MLKKIKPWQISIAILIILLIWLMIGTLNNKKDKNICDVSKKPVFQVRYSKKEANTITQKLKIYGETVPFRKATLRAETASSISSILALRGNFLKQGNPIIMLDKGIRPLMLQEAKAYLEQKSNDHNVAIELHNKGHKPLNDLLAKKAEYEQALYNIKKIELDLQYTTITAPFDGIVSKLLVEKGDYVNIGTPTCIFIDTNPLKVIGYASQTEIKSININQKACVHLATGEEVEGVITAIAPEANVQTHTFPIEIEIPNPNNRLLAGVSVEISIPVANLKAHYFSPQYLVLDKNETLGLKCINEDNKVVFYPVQIVETEENGLWVTGLPNSICSITTGHLFVHEGETIDPIEMP